ncbi:MAG: MFS transporter [Proteobacteria bacterium]|nr:MFS transporter [Pseudomonadota bacterium]
MIESTTTAPLSVRAPKSGRLGQVSWALFEWARNPYYILVVIYIFGPYFSTEVIGDPVRGQEVWGYINGFAGLITACLAPFLGAIADKVGRRKPWIGAFVIMMAPAIMMLWFAVPGEAGAAIVTVAIALTIAGTGSAFSEVFHNAMLPSIVPYPRLGSLSGLGLSLGNAGALIILVAMLYCFALPANGLLTWSFLPDHVLFGLDPTTFEHNRIAGPITAIWLLLFSLPLFLFTPDQTGTGVTARQAVRDGLADVWRTVRQLRHYKNVALYLGARMLFNDGKVAIMTFGMIYASGVFGWGDAERLLVGIFLTVFAVLGGLIGGWLDDLFGSKKAIIFTIGGNFIALFAAISITPTSMFFIEMHGLDRPVWDFPFFQTIPELTYLSISVLFALFITSAYANSRTMLARIAPEQEMTKFFGLYALSGQVTTFIAPILVATVTGVFHSQRAGFASILFLLGAGLAIMFFVREERSESIKDSD